MSNPTIEFDTQGVIDSLTTIQSEMAQGMTNITPKPAPSGQWDVLYKCPDCGAYGCGNNFLGRHLNEDNHKIGRKASKLQEAYAHRDEEAMTNTRVWFKTQELKQEKAKAKAMINSMKNEIRAMKGLGDDILNGRQIF